MTKIKRNQSNKQKDLSSGSAPDSQEAARICREGAVLQGKGLVDDAIIHYKKALELDPNHAVAIYNLASAYHKKGQLERAMINYQESLRLHPNPFTYNNMGVILQGKGKLSEAITFYKNALRLDPGYDNTYTNLGSVLFETGQVDEAESCYKIAIRRNPNNLISLENLLNMMLYRSRYDAQDAFFEHLNFAKKFADPLSLVVSCRNERTLSRRLKIGYVSPDFRQHSVAFFIEPILAAHDTDHFEVFCYSNVIKQDEVTARLRRYAEHWRDISRLPDEKAAESIRDDCVDILIDLAGHTADNRLLVFARKPAPVQVTWIGYPATTGLSTMDYKIVDGYTDPPGKTERFYSEKLVRLPQGFLCYLPDKDSPRVKNLPASKAGRITFVSFNNFVKISPDVILLWAKILRTIPKSRLVIKAKSLSDKKVCNNVINMFAKEDVSAERIALLPQKLSMKEHLGLYNKADIGLDTFPYNGATTTCEALWMGVPVITLAGKTHASRVGVSLLSNVGLEDLIAESPDEYLEIAVRLAGDFRRLQRLRESLRDKVAGSPLTDSKRFVSDLEKSYRAMWKEWCKKQDSNES
jgi:protein O-GlcNAc transferase